MFSFELMEDDGIVVLTSVGHTTVDDFQELAPRFFADVRSKNIKRVLLDAREFTGWASEGARSIFFYSWMEGLSQFDRIAVIGHPGIRGEVQYFSQFFHNAGKDFREFRPDQKDAAMEWLKSDQVVK